MINIKDIRYLSLGIIYNDEKKDFYYVIDGQKCDCILNIKKYELVLIDIACRVLHIDNIYIGRAYHPINTELKDLYGVYYPRMEKEKINPSNIIKTMTIIANTFKEEEIDVKELVKYEEQINLS